MAVFAATEGDTIAAALASRSLTKSIDGRTCRRLVRVPPESFAALTWRADTP